MTIKIKDDIERMQEDLKRALSTTEWKNKWVMVIDRKKCIGCNACTIACKAENVTPPGVAYTIVWEEEIGKYPNVRKRFTPRPCMQCDNPPCVKVCPVHATFKDEEGIVEIDYNSCIGCKYCINACPYGARCFDYGEFYTDNTPKLEDYEKRANFEYQILWPRKRRLFFPKSPIGNARKCHFCIHRIKEALLPACVVTCLGRARYFGDINDKKSLVSELIAKYKAIRLKEELGTEPSVYYID
jgi:molybdopterin-containing oxidoreductase family iron-sulfur binding subunit